MTKSEKIRRAIRAGKDVKEIAKSVGVSANRVYTLRWQMKKEDASKKRVVITKSEAEVAKKLKVPIVTYAKEKLKNANEVQVGGNHYKQLKVQPWDAMEAWMTKDAFAGFLRGNAIKYLARTDKKGGVEDLKKARHYLDKLIEVEESK